MAAPDPNATKIDSAQLKALSALATLRGVRKQSEYDFLGLPLYSIAFGPDLAKGEWRGRAKGVFALGDVATGLIAIGGAVAGYYAAGGVAYGSYVIDAIRQSPEAIVGRCFTGSG